jgi:hypothetical protein
MGGFGGLEDEGGGGGGGLFSMVGDGLGADVFFADDAKGLCERGLISIFVEALDEKLDFGELSSLDGVSMSRSSSIGSNLDVFDCNFLFCFRSLSFSVLAASRALVCSLMMASSFFCSFIMLAWR